MGTSGERAGPGPVRVGLLGAGRIVRLVHLEALASLAGVRVVAVADPDAAAREAAGARVPGVRLLADWREVLDAEDLDAVVVCLPNALHAAAAAAAFGRGLHVYLEKPLAISVGEGERAVEAWRVSGRVGMMGFNYRCHPMHGATRRRLASGEAGGLVAVRTSFTTPARALPTWQQARATGGGVLLNLGVHHFDLVPFLTGSPLAALSATLRSEVAEQDAASVRAELENGVAVTCEFSMNAAAMDRVELECERETLVLDRLASGTMRVERRGGGPGVAGRVRAAAALPWRALRAWRGRPEPSFALAFAAFRDAVNGAPAEFPDLAAGLEALRGVAAAERSAADGGATVPIRG